MESAANRETRAWMNGSVHRIAGRDSIASQDVCFPGRTSDRLGLRTQVRGTGETRLVDLLPGPLGYPAAPFFDAQKHPMGLLVNKRVGRDAGT